MVRSFGSIRPSIIFGSVSIGRVKPAIGEDFIVGQLRNVSQR